MANEEHLKVLRKGAREWNGWRKENPDVLPTLGGADLHGADLGVRNLRNADLCGANLSEADLYGAHLSSANFRGAHLHAANLFDAKLICANLPRIMSWLLTHWLTTFNSGFTRNASNRGRIGSLIVLLMTLALSGCATSSSPRPAVKTRSATYERAMETYLSNDFREAERLAVAAVVEAKEAQPPERSNLIKALDLALRCAVQRHDTDAGFGYFREAWALADRSRDPLEWAQLYSSFAIMAIRSKSYEEAEAGLRRIIPIFTAELGPNHLDTLSNRNNLASALSGQGKFAEAEAEHRTVLKIRRRVHGDQHPGTLQSWNALAITLLRQRKNAEAEVELQTLIKVATKALGPGHSLTLSGRSNLAAVYQAQGKRDKAETEYRATLAIAETSLGAEHPDTLSVVYNLALNLKEQERYEEARPFALRALEGREKVLGATDLETWNARRLHDIVTRKPSS